MVKSKDFVTTTAAFQPMEGLTEQFPNPYTHGSPWVILGYLLCTSIMTRD